MIQSSGNDPIPNHHRFASPRGAVDLSAFGDLAVQIHWGDAVEDQDVAWHVDANNSALHMAVPEVGAKQQGDGYLWCVYIIYICK